jgi:fumarate hydratase, class II
MPAGVPRISSNRPSSSRARELEPPKIRSLPVGIRAKGKRKEFDSLGTVEVPADHYWGAQTQRSLIHFSIGEDRMPIEVYRAYGYVKKAAAIVNASSGVLPKWKADLISRVCDEIISGKLDREFPLFVWQTGSGTQSNMNVNEVISNRSIQLVGGELGSQTPIHPNDDVNKSQSSNDTFPTAMHIATVVEFSTRLIPSVRALSEAVWERSGEWVDVVKIGRTHLQDATPLTVGQEWSGYASMIDSSLQIIESSLKSLYALAMGGTAVGTGINTPPDFAINAASELSRLTGYPFVTAPNKFEAQGSVDAMVAASAALRGLAVSLLKIANDIRWLGSGPRAGIHELTLPSNEPGSSIMPGKVNPTQEEAMIMVCIQVIGEDNAVAMAASLGNFELNTMRPMIINNVLHMARILGDVCTSLREHSIEGVSLDRERIDGYVKQSLMLVTALSPVIGYDKAAQIAHHALEKHLSLKEAALDLGFVDAKKFDEVVQPRKMVGDPRKDVGLKSKRSH